MLDPVDPTADCDCDTELPTIVELLSVLVSAAIVPIAPPAAYVTAAPVMLESDAVAVLFTKVELRDTVAESTVYTAPPRAVALAPCSLI